MHSHLPLSSKESVEVLRKGLAMRYGPPGLFAKILYDRRRKDEGLAVLTLHVGRRSWGQFGLAALTIFHKPGSHHDRKIEAHSAVLHDIKIHQEEWRHKGIGSEWIGIMKRFAKSQGAERFYAEDVQPESEGFFIKMGFARTNDLDWWMMKEF